MPNSRLCRLAFAVAVLVVVPASGIMAQQPEPRVERSAPAAAVRPDVRVDAPNTRVDVDRASGRVRVAAPHTRVAVDPDAGRVRVRAPFVDLDIRW